VREAKRRYKGPYFTVGRSDDKLLYKLRHCEIGKELRSMVHSNRLKAFNEDKEVSLTDSTV